MVAITVLLASVAAVFFFGISEEPQDTPTASFDFVYETEGTEELRIVHQSGQRLDADEVYVLVEGASNPTANGEWAFTDLGYTSTQTMGSGDAVTLSQSTISPLGSDPGLQDATVKVIWRSETNTNSVVLGEWSG